MRADEHVLTRARRMRVVLRRERSFLLLFFCAKHSLFYSETQRVYLIKLQPLSFHNHKKPYHNTDFISIYHTAQCPVMSVMCQRAVITDTFRNRRKLYSFEITPGKVQVYPLLNKLNRFLLHFNLIEIASVLEPITAHNGLSAFYVPNYIYFLIHQVYYLNS